MSVYATVLDVEDRCSGLLDSTGTGGKFSSSTFATDTQVQKWLDSAEAEVNQVLSSIGASTPYTASSNQAAILADICMLKVIYKVYDSYYRISGKPDDDVMDMLEAYSAALDEMRKDSSKWLQILEGPASSTTFRSWVTSGSNAGNLRQRIYDYSKTGLVW